MTIKNNAQCYLQAIQDEFVQRYDAAAGLVGEFDSDIYTPEYIKQHFHDLNASSLHSYRESLAWALAMLFLDSSNEATEKIINTFCRDGQVKDSEHPNYGELFWFSEEKHIRDRNGNFFNGASLFLIRKLFTESLKTDTLAVIDEVLTLLYPVFSKEREQTVLSYVNPSLGKYVMCVLLAEYFSRSELDHDIAEFNKYADFLMHTGVNETLSPTYIGVDIIILLMSVLCTENQEFAAAAKRLLAEIFLKQNYFFRERFPAPFRRGYNGYYSTKRVDILPWLLGWTREMSTCRDLYSNLVLAVTIGMSSERFPELFNDSKKIERPRSLCSKVHKDCEAYSYLDKDFLLGSFNYYPPETTAWQTVGVSGSGWQDGVVYLTLNNSVGTSGVLRLEAVDENNCFKCHPYEGEFKFDKIDRLYPHLSFPPEPKIKCVQEKSSLLCLYKIDKVDAILKSFGFNLHFSRFSGKLYDLESREIISGRHDGPLIIQMENTMIYLHPLTRVDMGRSDLLHGEFFLTGLQIECTKEVLDLKMLNYEGEAKRFIQNHISGGFFIYACSELALIDFIELAKNFSIGEEWISDRINAHVDRRDSIRKVTVDMNGKTLSLYWNHYTEAFSPQISENG